MAQPYAVLITGGAGYIGSHIAHLLQQSRYQVVVFDDLSTGNAWSVPQDSLIQADILDQQVLLHALEAYDIQTVIHLAAKSDVSESFQHSDEYFRVNLDGTKSVIAACAKAGVKNLIFSSTAAVYGDAVHGLVNESSSVSPISPYGKSKLAAEEVVRKECAKHHIQYMIFRYFNVIGAHPDQILGQHNPHANHLLKACLNCVAKSTILDIYGNDYDTFDGTAERDYLHVQDLASLHLQALAHLSRGGQSDLFNVGYGHRYSVLKFINSFEEITQTKLSYQYVSRRKGDPSALIADAARLQKIMAWTPKYASLEQMIASSWLWENSPKRLAV